MLREWIISASALTAAVLLLRLVFRRRISQRLQYLLWLPVLVRLLVPVPLFRTQYSVSGAAAELAPGLFVEATAAPKPSAAPLTPASPVDPQPTYAPAETYRPQPSESAKPVDPQPTYAPAETYRPRPSEPAHTAEAPPATSRPAAESVRPTPEPAQPPALNVEGLLARLWLAGSVAAGLWLLGVNLRFDRRLHQGRREFRGGKKPVYVSEAVASPCLFGLLRPAIYLTEACAEGPEEQRAQVLLHEETHRKQGDHVWGSLRCLALAVWWWNPLVWLAAVCSRRDGELSCDEKVMKLLGEERRLDYGRTLVALLPGKAPRPLLTAATLSGGARAMKERLDRIVKKPRPWVIAAAVVLVLALAAMLCAFAGKPKDGPAPAPVPGPVPTATSVPTAAPTGEPGDGTELLLWKTKRENVERIQYTLDSWGEQYLLRRGEEGFEEALDILFSLQGERCEAPRALTSRTLDLDPRVQLAWDGEHLYGSTNNGYRWLRLDTEGRPDQELSGIFERCGLTGDGVGGLAPTHENMLQDGSLTARTDRPVYDWGTLVSAREGMHEAYKETGSKVVDERGELCLILDNHTDGTVFYDLPDLEMLVDGQWHTRNFVSMNSFLIYSSQQPGERMVNIPLWLLAGEIEPGQYRICVTYFLADGDSPDHVVYAEFEIAPGAPEGESVQWPWAEEALAAYARAEEAWRWFTVDSLWELDSVDLDTTDGEGSYLITDERFADWETLENYLLQFFDRELVDRLLLSGPYKEVGGRVYGASASAGTDQRVGRQTDIQAYRAWNDGVYVVVRYELLSEEDDLTPVGAFTCTYHYDWGKQTDHRVFTEFYLPYTDGIPDTVEPLTEPSPTPGPTPTPQPTPEPSPEPTPEPEPEPEPTPAPVPYLVETYVTEYVEDRPDFAILWPLPAGWSVRHLVRDQLAESTPYYHGGGAVGILYLFDAGETCVGAVVCDLYEAEETLEDVRGAYSQFTADSDYRFDVWNTYHSVYSGDGEETALTKVYYSAGNRAEHGEAPEEKWNEGILLRNDALMVCAAVELESGVLSDTDLRAMAQGMRLIPLPFGGEEPEPEIPEPVDTVLATVTEAFDSYEEAMASVDAIAFTVLYDPGSENEHREVVDTFHRLYEKEYPGYGTLVYGEVGTGTVHGSAAYLFFVTEDGTRYSLDLPQYGMGPYRWTTDRELYELGRNFAFLADDGASIRWSMNCTANVNVTGVGWLTGGVADWSFDLRTGELRFRFRPGAEPEPMADPAPTPVPETAQYDPVYPELGTDWLTLPDGARWLTSEELNDWTAWFNADWMRWQFLDSAYEQPEDVDLWKLFYIGVDLREAGMADYYSDFANNLRTLSREEKYACLKRLGEIPAGKFIDSLPRSDVDALLRKYLGLGLDETNRRGLEYPYLPETDSFVHARSDGNWRSWSFHYGYEQGDETVLFYWAQLRYFDRMSGMNQWSGPDGIYRVVLRRTEDGVHFVSNLRPLYNGTDYIFETPYLTAAVPADYSGDYGRDITVLSPEPEVFESYEAALADTEAIDFRMGEEIEDTFHKKLEKEYPGYGTLVYGEVGTGTVHGAYSYLFFLTTDGRRYLLPTPQYGMGDMDLDLSEGGPRAYDGMNYALLEDDGLTVRWWINCVYETWPQLGIPSKQGGSLYYTLWLPTMEVFAYFRPEG